MFLDGGMWFMYTFDVRERERKKESITHMFIIYFSNIVNIYYLCDFFRWKH